MLDLVKCLVCLEEKSRDQFHKQSKSKTGLQFRCKVCDKQWHSERYLRDKEKILAQSKVWRKENAEKDEARAKIWRDKYPEKVKIYQRKTHLRKYGISLDEYNKMFEDQNGLCYICHQPEQFIHHMTKKPASLAVDHCHNTGETRRLLCKSCNNGLGLFKDSPEILRNAANYLESHS